MEVNKIINFGREKQFKFISEMGTGSLGYTILLKDEIIDELFVCKKYAPYLDEWKEEYFDNFKNEIKLLHLLYHKNIVRVFNYYLYPEQHLGYILMEYINGKNILDYIKEYPENINDIFYQVIDGFKYLEEYDVLHRDIRPDNIMVTNDGIVKIIDFGFGKKITYQNGFNKSISLNWWCETPNEFLNENYDFQTEIYFIAKLFEKIIFENTIKEFKYQKLLSLMLPVNPIDRILTFNECYKEMIKEEANEITFSEFEKETYTSLSNIISNIIISLNDSTKFIKNSEIILKKLEKLFQNTMLEFYLPSANLLTSCFFDGEYTYNTSYNYIEVSTIKDYIELLKMSSPMKVNIILNNLETKVSVIDRYSDINDEIPF